jgi:ATP-dependent DNA helicase RecQ
VSKQNPKKQRNLQEAEAIARKALGFEQLTPSQREAIDAIVEGNDTLVVQPTGSGKSAIYQIAGMMVDGPSIIVSPLIALQKDQVDSIRDQDLPEAAVINSTLRVGELRETLSKMDEGGLEFIFLAPEQLSNSEMLERIKNAGPSLFVVDEAHCISEWGHDFRPDYLQLGGVIETLGHPRVLAMTATASGPVRDEIVSHLGMRNPRIIARGFDRPNISLEVRAFRTDSEKRDALLDAVERAPKPGIVYCATRKHVEEIANALQERGVDAAFYHGGMRAKDRDQIQSEFMDSDSQVMVATNAFGMGVDKSNVRFVYHFDISDSLDSYYQEIGRAGRDGEPAEAILFYRPEDLSLQKFFKGGGKISEEEIKGVADTVLESDQPLAIEDLQEETNLSERKLAKAINRLEEAGAVERLPSGEIAASDEPPAAEEAASQAAEAQQRRRDWDQLRIEKTRAYAELTSCRRCYLLDYFGEDTQQGCGNCDNCKSGKAKAAPLRASEPFPPKSRVEHPEWGKGIVQEYGPDKITVLFDSVGRKTMSMETVREKSLLTRVA